MKITKFDLILLFHLKCKYDEMGIEVEDDFIWVQNPAFEGTEITFDRCLIKNIKKEELKDVVFEYKEES